MGRRLEGFYVTLTVPWTFPLVEVNEENVRKLHRLELDARFLFSIWLFRWLQIPLE